MPRPLLSLQYYIYLCKYSTRVPSSHHICIHVSILLDLQGAVFRNTNWIGIRTSPSPCANANPWDTHIKYKCDRAVYNAFANAGLGTQSLFSHLAFANLLLYYWRMPSKIQSYRNTPQGWVPVGTKVSVPDLTVNMLSV